MTLTVISSAPRDQTGRLMVLVQCHCGVRKEIRKANLTSTQSCGCLGMGKLRARNRRRKAGNGRLASSMTQEFATEFLGEREQEQSW